MLEFVGLESAKWRLRPSPGRGIAPDATERSNASLDQLAQMILEGSRELGVGSECRIGADKLSLIGEVTAPECIECLQLLQLQLTTARVLRVDGSWFQTAIHEKIGSASPLGRLQGFLELPLGAAHGC